MLKVHSSKVFVAMLGLLLVAGMLEAQTASPLTATPIAISVTYLKPSTPGSSVNLKVSATASTYFTLDPASVPLWLTPDAMNGTAVSAGVNIGLVANPLPGLRWARARMWNTALKVSGFDD